VSSDAQLTLDLISEDLPAAQRQAKSLGLTLHRRAPESIDLLIPFALESRDFLLRLRCDGYDDLAPSFQFVSPSDPDLTGPELWPRMSEVSYARGVAGEVVLCTPGVREYHQHPSHCSESHPKATWKLPKIICLAWRYLCDSGSYLGPGGV
jgi:hypothetical protein